MGDYRILVTGSRTWDDEEAVRFEVGEEIQKAYMLCLEPVVVHGKSPRGADEMADRLARELGVAREWHPAQWNRYGKSAGIRRNNQMVAAGARVCLAFIRGNSLGASHCVRAAERAGIPVRRVAYEPGLYL